MSPDVFLILNQETCLWRKEVWNVFFAVLCSLSRSCCKRRPGMRWPHTGRWWSMPGTAGTCSSWKNPCRKVSPDPFLVDWFWAEKIYPLLWWMLLDEHHSSQETLFCHLVHFFPLRVAVKKLSELEKKLRHAHDRGWGEAIICSIVCEDKSTFGSLNKYYFYGVKTWKKLSRHLKNIVYD